MELVRFVTSLIMSLLPYTRPSAKLFDCNFQNSHTKYEI